MIANLQGRSLLTLADFSRLEIEYLLELANALKTKRLGDKNNLLWGKQVALIFNKPSTRTRCAFETAVYSQGGQVTFLANSHIGHKESIEDTAKVLGRYYHGIGFRGYEHQEIQMLAKYSSIPVWNALTDQDHPTQVLADLLTMQEQISKPLNKVKCVFVGDGRNNMARALMIGAAKMGMNLIILTPNQLWPSDEFMKEIQLIAQSSGATVYCDTDLDRAVKNADVIYTDVWVSMGEEAQWGERINLLKNYQVDQKMLDKTGNAAVLFMHCLPAFHNAETVIAKQIAAQYGLPSMEVSDEVFRSRHSIVFEQSENRLHTIKALLVATIGANTHVNSI